MNKKYHVKLVLNGKIKKYYWWRKYTEQIKGRHSDPPQKEIGLETTKLDNKFKPYELEDLHQLKGQIFIGVDEAFNDNCCKTVMFVADNGKAYILATDHS